MSALFRPPAIASSTSREECRLMRLCMGSELTRFTLVLVYSTGIGRIVPEIHDMTSILTLPPSLSLTVLFRDIPLNQPPGPPSHLGRDPVLSSNSLEEVLHPNHRDESPVESVEDERDKGELLEGEAGFPTPSSWCTSGCRADIPIIDILLLASSSAWATSWLIIQNFLSTLELICRHSI
jgi:hypothetical protein